MLLDSLRRPPKEGHCVLTDIGEHNIQDLELLRVDDLAAACETLEQLSWNGISVAPLCGKLTARAYQVADSPDVNWRGVRVRRAPQGFWRGEDVLGVHFLEVDEGPRPARPCRVFVQRLQMRVHSRCCKTKACIRISKPECSDARNACSIAASETRTVLAAAQSNFKVVQRGGESECGERLWLHCYFFFPCRPVEAGR